MKKDVKEQNIISQLQIALKTCFKELSRIESLFQVKIEESTDIDALSESYKVNIAGNDYTLLVEYKSNGQPRFAKGVVNHSKFAAIQNSKEYWIFCAPFISAESARICKEAGIGYLDLAGNCYIEFDGIYKSVEGKKNPFSEKRELKSLFSTKSSRVVRVLLSEPNKQWKTEELQTECQVSIGLVSKVLKKIHNQAWGQKKENGFTVSQPEMLLRAWAESYSIEKQNAYHFYTLNYSTIEESLRDYCIKREIPFALTLFSGADRIAPHVLGDRIFAYAQADIMKIAESLALKPVMSGALVTIIYPDDEYILYGTNRIDGMPVVSPIQLFLDLKNYRTRGDEAAEHLFQEVIKPSWEKERK